MSIPTPPQKQSASRCHVNPTLAAKSDPHSKALHAEGVSCEACHGNAEHWRFEHAGWNPKTNRDEAYGRTGMTKLFDPAVRAADCAGCHVGAPASTDMPLREVNHDLIAAGHPRLNFEFTTYLRKMPPHWAEKDRETNKLREARVRGPLLDRRPTCGRRCHVAVIKRTGHLARNAQSLAGTSRTSSVMPAITT